MSKVRLIVPLTPQQLIAFRYEKNGRKSLSFTVPVYLNLQFSFFTHFREKLFCMQTTKAQISQRTCAVLPIIARKYDSLTCYMQKIKFLSDTRARIQTIPTGGGGGGGGGGGDGGGGRGVELLLEGGSYQFFF